MVQFDCAHRNNAQNKWALCDNYNLSHNRVKKVIAVNENKSTFFGINESQDEYTVHRIDTCIIIPTAQTPSQSDFLYINMRNGDFYIVELKGNQRYKAYSQLMETYKNISSKISEWSLNGHRYACAVLSGKRIGVTQSVSASIDEKRKVLEKNHFKVIDNSRAGNGSMFTGQLRVNLATGEIINS
jgi:effector-binding domain-containing protein